MNHHKMNQAESFARFRESMIKCKEQRRSVVFLDEIPKPTKRAEPLLCKAITNDGKPCKSKAVPQFKCFCTRHGKA